MASSDQRQPAPKRDNVRAFPTPDVRDILVFIEKDSKIPGNMSFAYGDAHPDSIKYPGHKMVWYSPEAEDRWARWYFAASRSAQDAYNFEVTDGDVLVRTYVFPRSEYLAGTIDPERPEVTDPDDHFTDYVFSHEVVRRSDQEFDGWFVTVYRYFQQEEKYRVFFDDELNRSVTEVTRIVPHDPTPNDGPAEPGTSIERRTINTFYDELVTQTLLPNPDDPTSGGRLSYPIKLDTLPTTVNKNLPPVLKAVNLVSIYAYAYSPGAAPAYDEDFYFDPTIQDPYPGPYSGRILRFLTDDPASVSQNYSIDQWVEVADTIPLVAGWWLASPDGNSAKALAKQITLRPTVHAEIPIGGIETLSIVQQKGSLPMTPGFRNFEKLGVITVDISPKKTRYGLYIVEVYQANITGAYGGFAVPFDQEGGSSGAGDGVVDTTPPPVVNTGVISSDNKTITGSASAGSAVVATYNGVELGKVMADAQGNYVIQLPAPYFTEPVTLQVRARRSGILSGALVVTTRDLAPGAPTASISSDLSTVSGNSQPGATITIGMAVVPQVETATVVGTITSPGQARLDLTAADVSGSPITVLVDVVNTNTAAQVAGLFRAALGARSSVTSVFTIGGSGANIVLTRRTVPVPAYDDPTLNMATSNESSAGLTPVATSVNTTQGLAPVTTVAASDGSFSYTFNPDLPNGTALSITATDLGGTSPSTELTASLTPPTIETSPAPPSFDADSYTNIGGYVNLSGATPAAGAVAVTAYFGDIILQSDVNDASGFFTIVLTEPRYRGEVITLVASLTSDSTIKSPAVTVNAPNLNLPIPVFEQSDDVYIGVAPDPSTYDPATLYKLVVKYENTGEELLVDVFPANNSFSFDFAGFAGSIGNQNGERYQVFFRFDVDPGPGTYYVDGQSAFINSPIIPLAGPKIGIFPPEVLTTRVTRWDSDWPTASAPYTGSTTPPEGSWIEAWCRRDARGAQVQPVGGALMPFPANKSLAIYTDIPGVTIQIKFPGQNIADYGPVPYTTPYFIGDVPFPFHYRTVGQPLNPTWFPNLANATVAGWYQNAAIYTRDTAKNAQPVRVQVILRAPDGRESTYLWTRNESYPWTDSTYNTGIIS